jgi:hypothetical protein
MEVNTGAGTFAIPIEVLPSRLLDGDTPGVLMNNASNSGGGRRRGEMGRSSDAGVLALEGANIGTLDFRGGFLDGICVSSSVSEDASGLVRTRLDFGEE